MVRPRAEDDEFVHLGPSSSQEPYMSASDAQGLGAMEVEAGPPSPAGGRQRGGRRQTHKRLWLGLSLTAIGASLAIIAALIAKKGRDYRASRIRQALVVDSARDPDYHKWLSSSTGSKTPVYHSYTFFNISNPDAFLSGSPPVLNEVGPFTFKEDSRKFNVQFSDDGRLVTYVTLYQYQYQGNEEDLAQMLYTFNVPYSAAANTVGGEANILKAGSQQALPQIREQMNRFFVPALREGAVVQAIQKSVEGADPINVMEKDGVQTLWGGACISGPFGLIKYCGFGLFERMVQVFHLAPKTDIGLMKLALNTNLEANPINKVQVGWLWDEADPLSMFNTDRYNASIRYGIGYWLSDNTTAHTAIKTRFKLTDKQFSSLRAYLQAIYASPLLEQRTVSTFLEALPAADAKSAGIAKWDDFVMRQFLVGDVIGRLKATDGGVPAQLESVQPDNPPELAFYAQSQGLQVFNGGFRWSRAQGQCLFALGKLPQTYFQANVSGLPPPPVSRPQFVDFGLNDSGNGFKDPMTCFPTAQDQALLHGYLGYLGVNFVADRFAEDVLQANGGLVTYRSVSELLGGYVSPVLNISLARDDPRAMSFTFMVNDSSIDGPARCVNAADAEQPYTPCRFAGFENTTEGPWRVFEKVPHTYHTGKGAVERLGAWQAYHGDSDITEIWAGGPLPLDGALQGVKGAVQYGYSDGTQFPPFGAVERAGTRLFVFVPNFAMPLIFDFQKDVVVKGVSLKRFVLSPETFSSSRPDAQVFTMADEKQEGLFNLTGLVGALSFLSKPHYRPSGRWNMSDVAGIADFNPDRDDSFIDVEPFTGKAMNARIQMQLVVGVDNGAFSTLHPSVYPAAALPVLYMTQHAEVSDDDARFFKKSVYGSEKSLKVALGATAGLGGLGLALGLLLVGLHFATAGGPKQPRGEEAKQPDATESAADEETKAQVVSDMEAAEEGKL